MRRTAVACLVCVSALCFAPATRALAQADARVATESAGRAHCAAAREAFSTGRFATALDEFKQAYELTQQPVLLYDIGTSADRLRRHREALEAFELYLVKLPTPANLAEVQGRIAALREALKRQTASPPDPSTRRTETEAKPSLGQAPATLDASELTPTAAELTPTAAELPALAILPAAEKPSVPTPAEVARAAQRNDGSTSVMPWVVIGVSAGAMLAGGALLAIAATRMYKVEHAPQGSTPSEIRRAHDSVPALSIAGFVSLGVGAAGAAAGLTWKLLPEDEKQPEAATAQLRLVPYGASLSGKF